MIEKQKQRPVTSMTGSIFILILVENILTHNSTKFYLFAT